MLPPDFKDLLEEFARAEVEYVLVGGYAVAFHGRPRATKDIDLVLGQPPLRFDLLRTIDGVDSAQLFGDAIRARIDGISVSVISLDALIANKRAAGRPQDLIDAEMLEAMLARRNG